MRYRAVRITNRELYTEDFAPPVDLDALTADVSGSLGLVDVDVDDAVSRLCLRAGLSAPQIDVTLLANITKQVRALAIAQVQPSRAPLELLANTYFFDCVMSGTQIKFVPRGAAVSDTLLYSDLGATMEGKDIEPLTWEFESEIELPAQVAVTYPCVDNDYLPDTQLSDRVFTSVDKSVAEVRVSLALTPGEAKGLAEASVLDAYVRRTKATIWVLAEYAHLEPTDSIYVTDADGNLVRSYILRRIDNYPLMGLDIVRDDTSILTSQEITNTDYSPSVEIDIPSDSVIHLLDINILRDADDDLGHYVSAKGTETPHAGTSVLKSVDDVSTSKEKECVIPPRYPVLC